MIIKKHYARNIVIYTDSLSSIMASLNRKTKDADAIHLANLIYEKRGKVNIAWVPSHCGIPGNERADQLAKVSINANVDIFEPISKNDAFHLVKKIYNGNKNNTYSITHHENDDNNNNNIGETNNNDHNINNDSNNNRYNNMNKRSPKNNRIKMNRKQQVAVFRSKIGYTRLTHKHVIEKTEPPKCDACNVNLTIEHILTECNKYNSERSNTEVDKIWRKLRNNGTDNLELQINNENEKILTFLEATGLIDEI